MLSILPFVNIDGSQERGLLPQSVLQGHLHVTTNPPAVPEVQVIGKAGGKLRQQLFAAQCQKTTCK